MYLINWNLLNWSDIPPHNLIHWSDYPTCALLVHPPCMHACTCTPHAHIACAPPTCALLVHPPCMHCACTPHACIVCVLTDSSTPNSQVIEAFSLCMFLFCTFYQTLPSGPLALNNRGTGSKLVTRSGVFVIPVAE